MIYQLKQALIDIKSISTNSRRNLVVRKNGEILKNGEIIFKGGKYLFANNLINENYYNFGDNQYQFLFENNNEIFLKNYVTNSISKDGVIVFENVVITDTIKQDNYYLKFSDNSKILLNENAVGGFILNYDNNTKSIFRSYNKLSSYSLLTGLYKWEVPLNRNGEIFKVLGVRENELVVCFKQGLDYYGLLGIAIETGKIMWNIDDNFLLNGLNMYFTPNQASIFSTKGEGRNSYFIELDLTTKQATRYGEIVDLCKEQLAISTSFLKDDLVYFTAGNHTFFPNTIGVFDYKTLKLLWKYTFSFDKNTHLKDMQVSENKLYVLDSGGTLHIFEKENEYNEII